MSTTRTVTLSCHSFNDMDNKVRAIKGARGLSGIGLKEAKDLVERVTPGHSETIKVGYDLLEPRFSEYVDLLKASGLTVTVHYPNQAARNGIADEIRRLVTYTSMTAQYDIGRALLDVLETYCPDPSEEYKELLKSENDDE